MDQIRIIFLGTSAGMPTRERNVAAVAVVMDGRTLLFDCGEGTQHQLMRSAVRSGSIEAVFITHLHGDHLFGLPGLLGSMSLNDRSSPLTVYGPEGIAAFVGSLPHFHTSFEVNLVESGSPDPPSPVSRPAIADLSRPAIADLSSTAIPDLSSAAISDLSSAAISDLSSTAISDQSLTSRSVSSASGASDSRSIEAGRRQADSVRPPRVDEVHPHRVHRARGYRVDAVAVDHTVPCLAYRIVEDDRPGAFDAECARSLGVPAGPLFGRLQRGHDIEIDGRVIRSREVVGAPRKGRRIVYCTDTRPCDGAIALARGADVLIHESTYAGDMAEEAVARKHSTAAEAATVAREAGAGRLILTHVSPRYGDTGALQSEAAAVFEPVEVASDFAIFEVRT